MHEMFRRNPPPDMERQSDGDIERNNGQDRREQGRDKTPRQKRYSIEQAISDRAQLTTIAFNGLALKSIT